MPPPPAVLTRCRGPPGVHTSAYAHGQADWFIKADDDTYVVWENLQTFLARHKSSQVHSFGRLFKENQPGKSYYSGGSGIIFSNALLHKLGEAVGNDGLKSKVWARPINGPEDAQTSKSLRQVCRWLAVCSQGPNGRV